MPLVVVNLGSEMIYVVRQRLIAQNVGKKKARRVLKDIVATMFAKDFVDQLFVPTPLYTIRDVYKIFQRLAHASIMRIQESSMNKLFELMVIGVKNQILTARSEHDYLPIATRHLEVLRTYLSKDSIDLLEYVQQKLEATYGMLAAHKLRRLKEALYDFFAGKHVRISVLTKLDLQKPNGMMRIDLGDCCPPEIPPPGKLKVYDGTGAVSEVIDLDLQVCKLELEEFNEDSKDRLSRLGENMYTKAEYEARGPERGEDDESDDDMVKGEGQGAEGKSNPVDELNVLADMIQVSAAADDGFKLEMDWADESDGHGDSKGGAGFGLSMLGRESKEAFVVDAAVEMKSMEHRMEELGFGSEDAGKCGDSDEEDLLEMMDNACASDGEFKAA